MTNGENGFAEWLSDEMLRRGWQQADLARAAGVTRATISNIINGMRGPGPRVCRDIARAFGVDEDEVLSRAGHRSGKPTADDMGLSDWIAAGRLAAICACAVRVTAHCGRPTRAPG